MSEVLDQLTRIRYRRLAGLCPACSEPVLPLDNPDALLRGFHDHCITPKDERTQR